MPRGIYKHHPHSKETREKIRKAHLGMRKVWDETHLKKCTKCKETFPISNFGKSPNGRNGLSYWCKNCKRSLDRVNSRRYRKEHPEWKKESNKRNANLINMAVRVWMKKYPERCSAQQKLRWAIKKGKVKRMPCILCGNPRSHGHHPNYSKPLEVIWLCSKHHQALHNDLLNKTDRLYLLYLQLTKADEKRQLVKTT